MKLSNYKLGQTFIVFALLIAIISSCTVSKRVHRKGWYIEWHHSYKGQKANKPIEADQVKFIDQISDETEEVRSEAQLKSVPDVEGTAMEESKELVLTESQSAAMKDTPEDENEEESLVIDESKSTPLALSSEEKAESSSNNLLLLGKILVLLGIVLLFAFSAAGNTNVIFSYLTMLALAVIIAGIVFWIKGRRKQEREGTRTSKSDEAKRFLKIGLILLLVGVGLAIGVGFLYAAVEPTAATMGNVVGEVATVTGGVIISYLLGFIAGLLIAIGLTLLIMGWIKD